MKYISLLAAAEFYGSKIKDYRRIYAFHYTMASRNFVGNTNYRPFTISTITDEETNATLKQLVLAEFLLASDILEGVPAEMTLPPIMEIEYIRHVMAGQLTEHMIDTMEQMAYLYVVMVMTWGHTDLNPSLAANAIEELEDIDDALRVMSAQELCEYNMPKYRTYSTGVLYGETFSLLFRRCKNMSSAFTEFYFHLPLLLSMFLVDYKQHKLKNWAKSTRLEITDEIEDALKRVQGYNILPNEVYTYCMTGSMTRRDIDHVKAVFEYIMDAVKNMNANMGTISYYNYRQVRGPERINAAVRLTDMGINWEEEIERVEEEKKKAAGEEEDAEESEG